MKFFDWMVKKLGINTKKGEKPKISEEEMIKYFKRSFSSIVYDILENRTIKDYGLSIEIYKELKKLISEKFRKEKAKIQTSHEWNMATNCVEIIKNVESNIKSITEEKLKSEGTDLDKLKENKENMCQELHNVYENCCEKLKNKIFTDKSDEICLVLITKYIYNIIENQQKLFSDKIMYPAKMLFGLKCSKSPRAFKHFEKRLKLTELGKGKTYSDKIEAIKQQTINDSNWLFNSYYKFIYKCKNIDYAQARWEFWFEQNLDETQMKLLNQKINNNQDVKEKHEGMLESIKKFYKNKNKTKFSNCEDLYDNEEADQVRDNIDEMEEFDEDHYDVEVIMLDVDNKFYDILYY